LACAELSGVAGFFLGFGELETFLTGLAGAFTTMSGAVGIGTGTAVVCSVGGTTSGSGGTGVTCAWGSGGSVGWGSGCCAEATPAAAMKTVIPRMSRHVVRMTRLLF
jgi:hypothetical protein